MKVNQVKKSGSRLKRKKRIVSGLVILSLIIGMHSVLVSAGDSDDPSLCKHHPVHTAECNYSEASEGSPCMHEHTEECYKKIENCIHEHSTDCGAILEDGIVDETLCDHVCSEENGCITME